MSIAAPFFAHIPPIQSSNSYLKTFPTSASAGTDVAIIITIFRSDAISTTLLQSVEAIVQFFGRIIVQSCWVVSTH